MVTQIESTRQLEKTEIFSRKDRIYVFMDPEQRSDPYLRKILINENQDAIIGDFIFTAKDVFMKFLSFKYIFSLLKNDSGTKEANFDLSSQIKGKRSQSSISNGCHKRQRINSSVSNNEHEVVCIVSDEEDEREEGEVSVSGEDSDDDIIPVVDDTQKPVREKPPVEEIEVDDSDDDIEVLEEKLKKSRLTAGNSRQYLDTNKAKAAQRNPVQLIDIDEDMEDVALVEPERNQSPDIEEMEQEDADETDAEVVYNTMSDIDNSLVPAPMLTFDDDDISEVSQEDEEIVEPSLDDIVPGAKAISISEIEIFREIVEPNFEESNEVYYEPVEPSLDVDDVVTEHKSPTTDPRKQQEEEASIKLAIENLVSNDSNSEDVVTESQLILDTSPRSEKENQGPKVLSSSLFSKQLMAREREAALSKPKDSSKPKMKQGNKVLEIVEESLSVTQQKPVHDSITHTQQSPGPTGPDPVALTPRTPLATNIADPLVQTGAAPKPVTDRQTDKSEKILSRIVATLHKRMSLTDEGIAVGNINARTVKFDKRCERRLARELPVVTKVENHLVIEFKETLNGDIQDSAITRLDSLTVMGRLERETSSTCQPTPYIINCVLTRLLLREEDHHVRNKSFQFLDNFLLLHLNNPTRESWLHLLLSACRNCPDEKTFKTFDLHNIHDLQACWNFFSGILKELLNKVSKDDPEEEDGCFMFLDAFVKILHRDFDSWWKHTRPKQSQSVSTPVFPILYYLLGGSGTNLFINVRSSILSLFSWSLKKSSSKAISIR